MQATINFNKEMSSQNFIDLDSIGNVCIEAINEDSGFCYYLLIKTELGFSQIFSYGPVIPEINKLCNNYTVSYRKEKYNEKKLISFISKWLNDSFKGITCAYTLEEHKFLDYYVDLVQNINNKGRNEDERTN